MNKLGMSILQGAGPVIQENTMSFQIQVILIIASIVTFIVILKLIRKSKLSTDFAVIWILWGIGVIILSLFPQMFYTVSDLLGISSAINALFLMMIFLLYMLVFFVFLTMSIQREKTKNLVHEVALLKKELNELKEEKNHD